MRVNTGPSQVATSSAESSTLSGRASALRSSHQHEPGLSNGPAQEQLLEIQNRDGGWGFRPGQKSAVEPTSLALLALSDACENHQSANLEAAEFLRKTQLHSGGWPNDVGDKRGGWVTALGCLALNTTNGYVREVNAGLKRLASSWPGEGGIWWRARNHILGQSHLVRQDHRFRGWSWTAGTSSWVEPTACALLALRHATGSRSFENRVNHRRSLAERMLGDRVCPTGGWNSGDPVVYGAAGQPTVGPTCWALFALAESVRQNEAKDAIEDSLVWLETVYPSIQGTVSLAQAHICLQIFGRRMGQVDTRLTKTKKWLNDVPALAWISLSAQSIPHWLAPRSLRKY